MNELNIYQRINAVMQEVRYVQKDGAISGGGASYRAVTHDQLVAVIRASLVKFGIVVEPKQVSGEFITKRDLSATPPVKMALYSGFYNIEFVNIDKPEQRTSITVEAHANDNGDKAPGKAMTYAVKTAVLKQFTLESGENDESRAEDIVMMSKRNRMTRTELTKEIQEAGYTQQNLADAFGMEFSQIDVKLGFDCLMDWKRQQG